MALLTIRQIRERFGVLETSVRKAIRQGQLRGRRGFSPHQFYIDEGEAVAWIQRCSPTCTRNTVERNLRTMRSGRVINGF